MSTGPARQPDSGRLERHEALRRRRSEDLAAFFTAASQMDADLRAAAARVNDGVDVTMVRLEPKTVGAVRAIDRRAVAQTIPGGLDDDLLRAVLLVHAGLATRRAAMNRVVEYASQAKARSLAAASPPATAVAADSRDSAEVAIRAAGIDLMNFGCDSCGSPVPPRRALVSRRNRPLPRGVARAGPSSQEGAVSDQTVTELSAQFEEATVETMITASDLLGLPRQLLDAVAQAGFQATTEPSPSPGSTP